MEDIIILENEEKNKENKECEMTMVETILFLYQMPYSAIARNYNDDPRKYTSLIVGDYMRIDRDVLKNICECLNVSTDLVLNGLCKNMEPKVYISNINKWFTFDEYIMFRSIGAIFDTHNSLRSVLPYRHVFAIEKCSWLDLNRNDYIDQLKEKMMDGSITIYSNSHQLRYIYKFSFKLSMEEQYEKILKSIFAKYIDEKTFNKCLQSEQMKKIKDKLSIDIDLNKKNYTHDELMQILNACLEQNQKNNNDTVNNNSKDDEPVKNDPSESNQDTADNNDDSDK